MTDAPKAKRRRREPMPGKLKVQAQAAIRGHQKRYAPPAVDITGSEQGWSFRSPYRSGDEEEWWALLGAAFGTRTHAVMAVLMDQLTGLIGTVWDEGLRCNRPEESELRAAISIVAALKPKNEAEAAQAAQAVALHLVAMKAGKDIGSRSWVDPRQANALANLTKAYTGVMDSMRKRGRSAATKQTITVKRETHVHYHDQRSVNVTRGGGGSSPVDQSDGAGRTTRARTPANRVIDGGTGQSESSPPLLGAAQTDIGAMPGTSDAEQDGLPVARGQGQRG